MALLPFLSHLSGILPIFLFVLFLKRNKQDGLWVIFLYCIASFFTDFVIRALKTEHDRFYIYFSFTLIEYTLFALFLFLSLKERTYRRIVLYTSPLFYTVAILTFIIKKEEGFDSLSASVEDILIIVYCILFLYEQVKGPTVIYIYQSKNFWIIIALLLYCASTLFLFIYAATFTQSSKNWYINNIFDIIKNILFCVSFVLKQSRKNKYPLENLYPDMY